VIGRSVNWDDIRTDILTDAERLWAKEFFQGQVMSISGTPNAVWIEQAARSAPNIEEVLCGLW
jgi:hypothetical protein